MYHEMSPLKVVLVDDAPVIVSHLESMLAPLEGVKVLGSAGNVADALALIEYLRPDVIVLDLRLPDGSGIKVLQHVKAGAEAPTVIVFTAHPSVRVREMCLALGADYFMDKSLEFRRVAQVLTELASKANGAEKRGTPVHRSSGRQSVVEGTGSCTPPQSAGDEAEGINKVK